MILTDQSAIASIYDAAVDEGNWDIALDHCVEFVGASSASLTVVECDPSKLNRVTRISRLLREINPDLVSYYNKFLIRYEREGWNYVLTRPAQCLIIDKDVWQEDDSVIVEREDFAFLLEHANILRRVVARLNDNLIWTDNIAFQFHKNINQVPEENLTLIQNLLPHMEKSIELGRAFNILRRQYRAVLTVLDFVEIGICIAMENNTVIVSNDEAQRILSENDGLYLDKKLILRTSNAREIEINLHKAITEVSHTAMGKNQSSGFLFTIERRSALPSYLIEISPLRDSENELGSNLNGAIIKIIDPQNSSIVRIDRLTKAYALTNSESAVTQHLIDGWTNTNIAEERGVSIETVKSQVKSIMAKTATKKRSDIIRLALKASPPIKDSY